MRASRVPLRGSQIKNLPGYTPHGPHTRFTSLAYPARQERLCFVPRSKLCHAGRLLSQIQAGAPTLKPASAASVLALAERRALSAASCSATGPSHTTTLAMSGVAAEDIDLSMQDGIAALWALMLEEVATSADGVPQPTVEVQESADGSGGAEVTVSYDGASGLAELPAADLVAYSTGLMQDVASGKLQSDLLTDVGLPAAARLIVLSIRAATC